MGKKRKSSKKAAGSPRRGRKRGPHSAASPQRGITPSKIREILEENPEVGRSLLKMIRERATEMIASGVLSERTDLDEWQDLFDELDELDGETSDGDEDWNEELHDVLDAAYDAATLEEARVYAKRALTIAPSHPAVLLLLHQVAANSTEAIHYLSAAIQAEARDLGLDANQPQSLAKYQSFDGATNLSRMLHLQVDYLWQAGRKDESVECLRRLLVWRPKDKTSIFAKLLPKLLTLSRFDEARSLLRKLRETSTNTLYGAALLMFHDEGPSPAAQDALEYASDMNFTLAEYLSGSLELPEERGSVADLLDRMPSVEDEEASDLIFDWMPAWRMTPGALTWLRKELELTSFPGVEDDDSSSVFRDPETLLNTLLSVAPTEGLSDEIRESFAKVTRSFEVKLKLTPSDTDLALLPQVPGEIWEADLRLLPQWLVHEGEAFLGYVLLLVDASQGSLIGGETLRDIRREELQRMLAANMMCPATGEARRPAIIRARPRPEFAGLADWCAQFGIQWQTAEQLEESPGFWDDFDMASDPGDSPIFPVSQSPDVEPDQLRSLYSAAADFYRQAPWLRVGRDTQIRIVCNAADSEPWAVAVFGNLGTQLGLALYDDEEVRQPMRDGGAGQVFPDSANLSISFHSRTDCNPIDVAFATEHSLPIATCDAWPEVMRIEDQGLFRYPLSDELRLLEAALRVIPLLCANPESESLDTIVSAYGGDLSLKVSVRR